MKNKYPKCPKVQKIIWLILNILNSERPSLFPEKYKNCHFIRYKMYLDIEGFIKQTFVNKNQCRIIEFGSSNGIIKKMFCSSNYFVTQYPKTDICNLSKFKKDSYDFVVLDQVLEHVADPYKAIEQIRKVLKKRGWFICTTPFMVKIHKSPDDYWRFSTSGLKMLMTNYHKIIVKSWGNKEAVMFHLKRGDWPTVGQISKMGLMHLANKNQFNYPCVVWCFAQK